MRLRLATAVLESLLVVCGAVAQTPSATTNHAMNGVWRGQINGLPAITPVVPTNPVL
jgi:hypothetical protein